MFVIRKLERYLPNDIFFNFLFWKGFWAPNSSWVFKKKRLKSANMYMFSSLETPISSARTWKCNSCVWLCVIFAGILLLNQPFHYDWVVGNVCQICYHWHRLSNGRHDTDFHPLDGPVRSQNFASVWSRRHVHLFHFHHYLILGQGWYLYSVVFWMPHPVPRIK